MTKKSGMHYHSLWFFWYHEGCPGCKARQIQYGFRLDPYGRLHEINQVKHGLWTYEEKKWILRQVGEIK